MPKETKRKPVAPALQSWEEADRELATLCQIEAHKRKLEAQMNVMLTDIRSRFQPDLDEAAAEAAGRQALIEQFCIARRADLEARKSRDLTHGTVSFRLSPPSVRLLNRKWKWESVLATIINLLPRFVRIEKVLDKAGILAAYAADDVTTEELAAVGIEVAQKETFGIELKYEEAAEAAPLLAKAS